MNFKYRFWKIPAAVPLFTNLLCAIEIINLTRDTFPGGIIKIVAESPRECSAEFLGGRYPLFKEGNLTVGVIPVKLDAAGEVPLKVIEHRFLRKSIITEKTVVIKEKKFRKSKMSFVSEEISSDEKKLNFSLKKEIKAYTKIKYSGKFGYPLKKYNITSGFGDHRVDRNGRSLWRHKGVDLAAPTGTPVRPVARGKVVFVIRNSPVYGNTVLIDHGRGIKSIYIHLSEVGCKKGQIIDKDTVLGKTGSTGISMGPHLHLGIYLFGIPVDPVYALKIL